MFFFLISETISGDIKMEYKHEEVSDNTRNTTLHDMKKVSKISGKPFQVRSNSDKRMKTSLFF